MVGCLRVQGEKTSKWVGGGATLKGLLRECSNWRRMCLFEEMERWWGTRNECLKNSCS